ncbi:MAG: hypothetical protein K2N46_10350 [Lachnospiraceae bacterium]|nr:hypothetical protein [Lachnospiraceae bacterium]
MNAKDRSTNNKREAEEDFLEGIYLMQQKGLPLDRKKVCAELKISKREFMNVAVRLMNQECLTMDFSQENEEVIPTVKGNVRAQEVLRRHHYLTDFLQMICKVERETAEENACRLEHVITPEVFCGITEYMKYGEDADRIVSNWDINRFYDEGEYEFTAGIYLPDRRYPRVFAPEYACTGGRIFARVGKRSVFRLVLEGEQKPLLWYLEDHVWRRAGKKDGAYLLPTYIFRYTICRDAAVTEGDACIAFTKEEPAPGIPQGQAASGADAAFGALQRQTAPAESMLSKVLQEQEGIAPDTGGFVPQDSDIRELNVHLW